MKRPDSILQKYYMSKLPKFQQRPGTVLKQRYGVGPMMGDLAQQSDIPSQEDVARQMQIMRQQQEQERMMAARARYEAMPKIGPAKQLNYSEQVEADQRRKRLNQQYADQNPEVTLNEYSDIVPSGYGRFIQTYGKNLDKFARSLETPLMAEAAISMAPLALAGIRKGLSYVPKLSIKKPSSSRLSSLIENIDPETGVSSFVKPKTAVSTKPVYGRDAQGVFIDTGGRRQYFLEPPPAEIELTSAGSRNLQKPMNLTNEQYDELLKLYQTSERSAQPQGGFEVLQRANQFGISTDPILTGRSNLMESIRSNASYQDFQNQAIRNYINQINSGALNTDFINQYPSLLERLGSRLGLADNNIFQRINRGTNRFLNQLDVAAGELFYNPGASNIGIDLKAQAPILEQQINQLLQKGVGVKKNNLPLSVKFEPSDDSLEILTQIQGAPAGRITLRQNKPGPKTLSELIRGVSGRKGWENTKGFKKAGDFPFSQFADVQKIRPDLKLTDLFSQGVSGEYNKAINEVLKSNNLGNILSGGTGHSTEGLARWKRLVEKGLAKDFGDSYFMLKKQGGPILNSNGYKDGAPPQGSNWRIPGNKITMNLPGMPNRIFAVPNIGLTKFVYKGEDAEFPGADYVDEYEMQDGGLPKFQQRPGTYRPLNQLTDAEKRQLAQRVVKNARARIENERYVSVPESLRNTQDAKEYGAYSCIGGVCTILEEEKAIPKVIWSNTEFAKSAPQLGFPNQGWGLKGIQNLEPGDVLQWMDPNEDRDIYKAYPHHAQIFLGVNPKTKEYEFFDNFNEEIRSYSKKTIEDYLNPGLDEYESQAQIYKINPYSPKTDPYTATNIKKEQKQSLEYEMNNLIPYEYRLRSDSPLRAVNASGNVGDISEVPAGIPEGAKQFFKYVNNPENKKDLLKKLYDLGYKSRATNEDINDSFLNVFGILEQENKLSDRWFGGTGGVENTYEKIAKPKSASIGPGQIKFNSIPRKWRKEFDINSPKDLYDWEKILPLMTAWDINSKQQMSNWGPSLSKRIIGSQYDDFSDEGDLSSNEFKWSEGRMSPYFYRGPGPRDIKQNLEQKFLKRINQSAFAKNLSEDQKLQMADEYIDRNIRKEQKVFDPGSYGKNVWDSWARNIERTLPVEYKQNIPARQIYNQSTGQWEMIPEQERKMITLPEVIMTSRPSQRKIGGLTKYQQRPGTISLRPTAADSTAIYLNALEKEKFYRNNPKYKKVTTENKDYDVSFKNKKFLQQLANESIDLFKQYTNTPHTDTDFGFSGIEIINIPAKTTRNRLGRLPGSNVVFKAPDILNTIDTYYNPNSPVILFSPEIMPQGERIYISDYYGDTARAPYYEPLAVKPYAMRTEKEKIEWERKYGKKEKQAPKQKLVTRFQKLEDVDLPKQIQFKELPQPNVSFRTAPKMQMISDTPTNYSYTYPSGNQQKTIYFPGKSAWQAFVNQFDGLNTEQRAGSFSATPGMYAVQRRPNPIFENIEYKNGGWLTEYKNGGQHGGLDRWFAEKWVDIKTGKPCGRQEGEDRGYPACRPSKRMSSKTPKTSSELSSEERAKFKSAKTSSQRIPYSHKRRK